MKTLGNRSSSHSAIVRKEGLGLDLRTIRLRVAKIRGQWSEKEKRERAAEGKRRRAELERLLSVEESPTLALYSPSDEMSLVV
jgi:hypothetical protein